MECGTRMEQQTSLSVIYSPNHIVHKSSSMSPENPERLTQIIQYLKGRARLFGGKTQLVNAFLPATGEDILRVHTGEYVKFIQSYCEKGGGFLGDSTYFNHNSYKAALLAAGGAIEAAKRVAKGKDDVSFALIRPPGHHASADNYGGYCIFNNGAVVARYLQDMERKRKIMFIDWDAHAANGTMRIFYEDPTVLNVSIHRDPGDFYPHDGYLHQIGRGIGRGSTVNIPLPEGASDEEYMTALKQIIIPLYNQFDPDFVIGCNGFDAHFRDQYAKLQLTSQGYHDIAYELWKRMKGKLVVLMEGGYNRYTGQLAHSLLSGLVGLPNPVKDSVDSLSYTVTRQQKIHKITDERMAELKQLLSEFYDF